jgi:ABC-type phosphate transport system permease subunit
MAQVNVNTDPNVSTQRPMAAVPVETYDSGDGARTAATSNLTWAIAVVLIIAAIAVALVFVFHNVHP